MIFKNRQDAGRQLGRELQSLHLKDALVIGLPRGGVVVAAEIAKILDFPLDVIIPRKIGAPFNPELAIGALVEDTILLNDSIVNEFRVDPIWIQTEIAREKREAARRLALYRNGKPPPTFKGRTIIIVDDGIATGATIRASLHYLKSKGAGRLIAAIPVAPPEAVKQLQSEGFELVCLYTPASFAAVGQFYEEFLQTQDSEVIKILRSW